MTLFNVSIVVSGRGAVNTRYRHTRVDEVVGSSSLRGEEGEDGRVKGGGGVADESDGERRFESVEREYARLQHPSIHPRYVSNTLSSLFGYLTTNVYVPLTEILLDRADFL